MIAIPWRKVNTKLQSVFFSRFAHFLHNISCPVFVWAVFDRMFGISRRPQTKSIVMFTGKYYAFHPCIFERRNPLIGIQVSGIENTLFFVAIAPFQVGKGICREMYESIRFHFMPGQLFIRWNRQNR
jgi:hypothetical protein